MSVSAIDDIAANVVVVRAQLEQQGAPKNYLQIFLSQYERECIGNTEPDKEALAIYVPLSAQLRGQFANELSFDLDLLLKTLISNEQVTLEQVRELGDPSLAMELKSETPTQVLIVEGRAGTGKTLTARHLCRMYHEADKGPKSLRIPWFIPLSDSRFKSTLATTPSDVFAEALVQQFSVPRNEVTAALNALRQLPFVLILDGLDELGNEFRTRNPNLHHALRLDQWPNSLVWVGCRSDFLSNTDAQRWFRPRPGLVCLPPLPITIELQPFTNSQRESYISKYVERHRDISQQVLTKHLTEDFPGLFELAQEALTTSMVIEVVAALQKGSASLQRMNPATLCLYDYSQPNPNPVTYSKWRRVELYALFVQGWVNREFGRMGTSLPDIEQPQGFPSVLADVNDICSSIAVQLFLQNQLTAKQSLAADAKENVLDQLLSNARRAGAGHGTSPVTLSNGVYSFLHKSVIEYFAALRICRTTIAFNDLPNEGSAAKRTRIALLPLCSKYLTHDYGVLRFVADFIQYPAEQRLRTNLLSIINSVRVGTGWFYRLIGMLSYNSAFKAAAVGAANSLTVLHAASVPLPRDLSSAWISPGLKSLPAVPVADLTGCDLSQHNLTEAYAVGVKLENVNLDQANLTDADFRYCDFGQGPMLSEQRGRVLSLALSHDNLLLFSASDDALIRRWNLDVRVFTFFEKLLRKPDADTPPLRYDSGHNSNVTHLALTPDGECIISASNDTTLQRRPARTEVLGPSICMQRGHSDVKCLQVSPDGKYLYSYSGIGYFFRHCVTGDSIESVRSPPTALQSASCVISPDCSIAFISTGTKQIQQWLLEPQPNTLQVTYQRSLSGHSAIAQALALHPRAPIQIIYAGCDDGNIFEWSLAGDHDAVQSDHAFPKLHNGLIRNLIVSSDEKCLFSCSEDRTIIQWSLLRQPLRTIRGHSLPVNCLALSSDNNTLYSGSDDGTVRCWKVNTARKSGDSLDGESQQLTATECVIKECKLDRGVAELLLQLGAK